VGRVPGPCRRLRARFPTPGVPRARGPRLFFRSTLARVPSPEAGSVAALDGGRRSSHGRRRLTMCGHLESSTESPLQHSRTHRAFPSPGLSKIPDIGSEFRPERGRDPLRPSTAPGIGLALRIGSMEWMPPTPRGRVCATAGSCVLEPVRAALAAPRRNPPGGAPLAGVTKGSFSSSHAARTGKEEFEHGES